MQPAHSGDDGSSSANLKKWGPIVGIVLVVGAVVGLVVATGGTDRGAEFVALSLPEDL